MHYFVLGAGLVGSAIARDLAQDAGAQVTVIDLNQTALERIAVRASVRTVQADLLRTADFGPLLAEADLVVCAVPGFMGFATLRKILEAGKSVVDISFFAEDPFELDDLAKARGVTAVVDCGVAPGLANLIVGDLDRQLDRIERYECYVGGLPRVRTWPHEYKAVFSPIDVLEEYTRPARFVEYGQTVVRPALSDVELRDFPGAGTLEAFNTDGLRTLARTIDAPFMKEKTLRYPGHANLMRALRDSGFFAPAPIDVDGQHIAPLRVTAKLLFDQWKLRPGEHDLTVMQVVVEGWRDGHRVHYTYDLLDGYDAANDVTSMARTTGYTCTATARLVANGAFHQPGICPPEYVGCTPGCLDRIFADLAERNVHLTVDKHADVA
jgi:saccharopine dehydrogenase-like NADP-dependent oxidoreductase